MPRLIDFVIRYREHIVATLLAIIALSLMSYGDVTQLGGFRALVIGGLGLAQQALAWIPNPLALQRENQALRQINMELQQEAMLLRKAGIENQQLRSMLQLRQQLPYPLLAASVVGKTVFRTRQYITIDRGSQDGVSVGMNVITDAGLVGRVIGTSPHYALVETLFNRDVRVSARLASTRDEGIISWDGFEHLVLQNIPKTHTVSVGDRVVTSSLSTRFVPEIPIGTVRTVINDPTSMFYRIVVEPAVAFWRIEQVFVVQRQPPRELMLLEDALQEYINRRMQGK
ncbi:MAG: rod shape-determining protein MreC [Bacteroidota bacterium]|nr:rod shape-determining protein MreC [Candidatus Kapabacteria bacterium]MCS7302614.1 rod shape-determining protein MreC [Candidatus Kapabacteria bacterium]MCX7936452.1 rod shape-determining protein MreC [Chlorobiota bacterium]MDW8074268.1 rod shape-determining protein MreC [Bacteroidota bacterium]MDW8271256.1 rod shape-determining protein MreC [Bacteroidota bacterium]